jgi:hypothetical protein
MDASCGHNEYPRPRWCPLTYSRPHSCLSKKPLAIPTAPLLHAPTRGHEFLDPPHAESCLNSIALQDA